MYQGMYEFALSYNESTTPTPGSDLEKLVSEQNYAIHYLLERKNTNRVTSAKPSVRDEKSVFHYVMPRIFLSQSAGYYYVEEIINENDAIKTVGKGDKPKLFANSTIKCTWKVPFGSKQLAFGGSGGIRKSHLFNPNDTISPYLDTLIKGLNKTIRFSLGIEKIFDFFSINGDLGFGEIKLDKIDKPGDINSGIGLVFNRTGSVWHTYATLSYQRDKNGHYMINSLLFFDQTFTGEKGFSFSTMAYIINNKDSETDFYPDYYEPQYYISADPTISYRLKPWKRLSFEMGTIWMIEYYLENSIWGGTKNSPDGKGRRIDNDLSILGRMESTIPVLGTLGLEAKAGKTFSTLKGKLPSEIPDFHWKITTFWSKLLH